MSVDADMSVVREAFSLVRTVLYVQKSPEARADIAVRAALDVVQNDERVRLFAHDPVSMHRRIVDAGWPEDMVSVGNGSDGAPVCIVDADKAEFSGARTLGLVIISDAHILTAERSAAIADWYTKSDILCMSATEEDRRGARIEPLFDMMVKGTYVPDTSRRDRRRARIRARLSKGADSRAIDSSADATNEGTLVSHVPPGNLPRSEARMMHVEDVRLPDYKSCSMCMKDKPKGEFYVNRRFGIVVGLSGYCRECTSEYNRVRNARLSAQSFGGKPHVNVSRTSDDESE